MKGRSGEEKRTKGERRRWTRRMAERNKEKIREKKKMIKKSEEK